MMAEVARGHEGDGGDRPPHGIARGVPSGCQSSQAKNVNANVVRLISNLVGSMVPLHYHTWHRVPTKYKDDLYLELETYFDLNRSYAQRRHLEDKMGLKPQHIERWRQMRYKEGSGWCTNRAQEDWEKI
ncbi:unnamed protein product [Lactuca virosa]|uniref:Homeobox domain-containing protein n=1 Tax=Lactuca virosa TaxID=75947 RepID=A0AAU9P9B9_9ASTR|nr:unnamed protein product [Lactuca virosa]